MSTEGSDAVTAAQELLDYVKSHELDDEARSSVLERVLGFFNNTQILAKQNISVFDKIEEVRRDLTRQRLTLRRNINFAFSALIGAVIIVTSLIGPNRYIVFLLAMAALLVGQAFILLRWRGKRRALSGTFRILSDLEAEGYSLRQQIDEVSRRLEETVDLIRRGQRGSE